MSLICNGVYKKILKIYLPCIYGLDQGGIIAFFLEDGGLNFVSEVDFSVWHIFHCWTYMNRNYSEALVDIITKTLIALLIFNVCLFKCPTPCKSCRGLRKFRLWKKDLRKKLPEKSGCLRKFQWECPGMTKWICFICIYTLYHDV